MLLPIMAGIVGTQRRLWVDLQTVVSAAAKRCFPPVLLKDPKFEKRDFPAKPYDLGKPDGIVHGAPSACIAGSEANFVDLLAKIT